MSPALTSAIPGRRVSTNCRSGQLAGLCQEKLDNYRLDLGRGERFFRIGFRRVRFLQCQFAAGVVKLLDPLFSVDIEGLSGWAQMSHLLSHSRQARHRGIIAIHGHPHCLRKLTGYNCYIGIL
jgi:hypothetical protein